jgi:hypothetical protein
VGWVIVAHLEHRGLGRSVLAEFVQFVRVAKLGLVFLFSLAPALGLVSLLLLPCLLFLTLCKC